MNYKSQIKDKHRGNYNIGVCFPDCECQSCKRLGLGKYKKDKFKDNMVYSEKG